MVSLSTTPMMLIPVWTLSLLSMMVTMGRGYVQELILYETLAANSPTIKITEKVEDIQEFLEEKEKFTKFSKLCTRGLWFGYSDQSFRGDSTPPFGPSSDIRCITKKDANWTTFISIRFGGHQETSKFGISVYPQENFVGEETFVTGPASALLYGKSFILSGSTGVTLYEEADFIGNPICSHPTNDNSLKIYGVPDVTASLGIHSISSLLRGCD